MGEMKVRVVRQRKRLVCRMVYTYMYFFYKVKKIDGKMADYDVGCKINFILP
jgi:hypothetical protein